MELLLGGIALLLLIIYPPAIIAVLLTFIVISGVLLSVLCIIAGIGDIIDSIFSKEAKAERKKRGIITAGKNYESYLLKGTLDKNIQVKRG